MIRNLAILFAAALVIALPFALRPHAEAGDWRPGDPTLVIVTPHNEAICSEFARAFSEWHRAHYGQAVRVDWRAIGGTTEIVRYLESQYRSSARARWTSSGKAWTAPMTDALLDKSFDPQNPPADPAARARWEASRELVALFRTTDDADVFSSRVDLFFGGGEYDHDAIRRQGIAVTPWPEGPAPAGLFRTASGVDLVPERMAGQVWRTATFFGNAVSTFGICYNLDRYRQLGIAAAPARWEDLADPRLFRQVGVADPTKSGSIAKAFEIIVHQKCQEAVLRAGFSRDQCADWERAIGAARLPPGQLPPGVPAEYQRAIEDGWLEGMRLVQRIGANARYFTDSSGKVPIDVSTGNAAAGLAIDFYGRFQAQYSRGTDGAERMRFVAPTSGSGVSCDPISLLRGAPHRAIAVRFIEFLFTEDAQRIWTYKPGTPGGPKKYALRRLPIRRDFYPSTDPEIQAAYERHRRYTADDLGAPGCNPYALAEEFTYYPRWTGAHFGIQRDIIRSMCIDSGEELRAAWAAILRAGGPERNPEAMALLQRMPDAPEPLTWMTARSVATRFDRLDYLREWTAFFRASYDEARRAAEEAPCADR